MNVPERLPDDDAGREVWAVPPEWRIFWRRAEMPPMEQWERDDFSVKILTLEAGLAGALARAERAEKGVKP